MDLAAEREETGEEVVEVDRDVDRDSRKDLAAGGAVDKFVGGQRAKLIDKFSFGRNFYP